MRRSSKGFALTGKAKPAQFSERVRGQTETGFVQKTEKQATAAMQGRAPSFAATKAKPKNNGTRQFGKPPGKAVF